MISNVSRVWKPDKTLALVLKQYWRSFQISEKKLLLTCNRISWLKGCTNSFWVSAKKGARILAECLALALKCLEVSLSQSKIVLGWQRKPLVSPSRKVLHVSFATPYFAYTLSLTSCSFFVYFSSSQYFSITVTTLHYSWILSNRNIEAMFACVCSFRKLFKRPMAQFKTSKLRKFLCSRCWGL